MAEDRPSLLKATAPWFAGALVASAALFWIGRGGDPVGHAMITALPWLFWAGPAVGAWRGLRVLDDFAEEVPGRPEARAPLLGYPSLAWPEHGVEAEVRTRGLSVMGLFVHVEGQGTAKAPTGDAREAARAALEGRLEHPQPPDGAA
jgi:hypothetical protein